MNGVGERMRPKTYWNVCQYRLDGRSRSDVVEGANRRNALIAAALNAGNLVVVCRVEGWEP